jgi:hypothetical protein
VRIACEVTRGGTSSHPHVLVSRKGDVISGKDKDGRSGAGSETLCCDFRFLSIDGMWAVGVWSIVCIGLSMYVWYLSV